MSTAMGNARGRARLAFAAVMLLGTGLACKGHTTGPAPSASADQRPAPPSGFRRIEVEGWSLDLPTDFQPVPRSPDSMNLTWLVYEQNDQAKGSPRVMFARHTKPADYPSRVFGLTALNGLNRARDKRVLASRQHLASGLEVTDIEVLIHRSRDKRVQWRRLFVHSHVAYTLIYSVAETEAQRHRHTAETVLQSLHRTQQ